FYHSFKGVSSLDSKHKMVRQGGVIMKIDKNTINMILKMNDDRLWSTIKLAISRSGTDALKDIKRPEDMTKLREILSNLTDADIERVTALLSGKGGKK
ncbi:MAG: hypothetical protein IKA43_06510, partial [Clostridia bacterium]|nr:hypothetical protein [Clostridia bacterium]